jgi:DNA repair protein RecO (recombination protein O)
MIVTTKGIVLSSVKYGDSHLIVSLFTEISGLKSYMLHRILGSKRGKLKSSYFQPLTLLELEAVHKDKGSLERIREAKVVHPYRTLHVDMIKTTMVIFLAEVIKSSIREEEKNIELFNFLERSLIWLDDHEQIANFHILFLLKLSKYLGFYPNISDSNKKYFNLLEGRFQDSKTNDYCEEGVSVQALRQFFGIDFDRISSIKLTKIVRFETLNLLLMYYKLHLHNFNIPKSLLVLKQLFEHP